MINTEVLKVDAVSPDDKAIRLGARILRNGGLVAFPTETVYGIGVNCLDEKAVKKLCEVKNRPANKPFTIHISRVDAIREARCEVTKFAEALVKAFWPGPLTIIFKFENGKLGFRMPANSVAKALISESGVPVAAPSANISGGNPPTSALDVIKTMEGKIDLILDAGETEHGEESTIVDTSVIPYKIVRKGALGEDKIEEVWKSVGSNT